MSYALILTDGKPGHENQSKALAEGLGLSFRLCPCTYSSHLKKSLSYLLDRIGVRTLLTTAQLPDEKPALIIGAGSNTFYTLKVMKQRLGVPCVAILTPSGYRLDGFDCILSPAFDNAKPRANLITIPTNLTPARPDYYAQQTQAFFDVYKPQNKKAVGIIIGGANAIADVTPEWLKPQLDAILKATPDSEHWVTTSRRTSPEVDALLSSYPLEYKLIFSENHFNPIPAFVTQCHTLFVTAESTGMLSESVAIGSSDVEILDNLTTKQGKFARFVEQLCSEGYAHRFDGTLGHAHRKIDAAATFAQIKQRLN